MEEETTLSHRDTGDCRFKLGSVCNEMVRFCAALRLGLIIMFTNEVLLLLLTSPSFFLLMKGLLWLMKVPLLLFILWSEVNEKLLLLL